MWYCDVCEIEVTKYKKNRHIKSVRHQNNIGNVELTDMWYCDDCKIEITKCNKNSHIKSVRHQNNIGNVELTDMWYCDDCKIEITKSKKSRHIKSGRHQNNIGNNPYHHGKIYKIICNDTEKQYIGSTILPIENRLKKHKCDKKQYEEEKSYAYNCASYQLLDNCKIELVEEYNCETENELKTREQYHIENNECVNFIRAKGIEKSDYDKQYREKNKEKIKAHKGHVVNCECGMSYTHQHATRHKRSKHHINYIENVKI